MKPKMISCLNKFRKFYSPNIEQSFKVGNIVARKSYNKDILFVIDKIIGSKSGNRIAILKGLNVRIVADSPISDLVLAKNDIRASTCHNVIKSESRFPFVKEIYQQTIKSNALILHLDGDKRYSEKSARYYKQSGLRAIVKNIPEYKQPNFVRTLLDKYDPDILVITGHDAMLKNGTDKHNIYNYRNSKHFINTVKEARKWASSSEKLVIFAGACQSYFEAIINSGADFASSPGRVLIDFVDPLIVAKEIALTDTNKYISINDIADNLTSGIQGISGTIVRGKKQ